MKSIYHIIFVLGGILFSLLLSRCITEYHPKDIDEINNILVVEGTITEGETFITLSRSVGLLENFTNNVYVEGAVVYIERNDGIESDRGDYKGSGEYVIEMPSFDKEKKYRLHIVVDGMEYVSEYLSPLFTPEIENIRPEKKGKGEPVYICVDTSDPSDQSRYYRWRYKDNWEIWAPFEANIGRELVDGIYMDVWYDLATPNNITYCWGSGKSTGFLLESTDRLSENTVIGKRLISIDPHSPKLSVLYYIAVEQYQLRKEAYDYFYNLQKNVEQGSGIFSGMPTEMRGNIQCLTNPDIDVIGYIEVSTITRKDKYVYAEEGFYEYYSPGCQRITEQDQAAELGYVLYYYEVIENIKYYASPECVDCRQRGGTKNKPDFWPTNRL